MQDVSIEELPLDLFLLILEKTQYETTGFTLVIIAVNYWLRLVSKSTVTDQLNHSSKSDESYPSICLAFLWILRQIRRKYIQLFSFWKNWLWTKYFMKQSLIWTTVEYNLFFTDNINIYIFLFPIFIQHIWRLMRL